MNGYVLIQQVKYVFYYPQKVFNLPSVFINVLILTLLWSLVYNAYFKIGQVFKERLKTKFLQWNRVIHSLWHGGCGLSMALICSYEITAFLPCYGEGILGHELNHSSEVVFSLICAFHLHQACLMCKTTGLSSLSLRWIVATVAFCLSYSARCLRIGVTFVLIWSVITVITDIIILSVNMVELLWKKTMGRCMSGYLVLSFGILWAFFYLYIYPFFVLLPISALNSKNSSVSFISLLLLSLWTEYFLDWYTSPVKKFIWMSATRSFPSNWINSLFQSPNNDLTEKLLSIRKVAREKEQNIKNQIQQKEEMKSRQNSQTMMQTIRCILLLKKKLRRMRERKNPGPSGPSAT